MLSMETHTYKEVFQGLLSAQDLQPLIRFKSTRSATMLYPDAQSYPQFFNHNLMAPGRVIKAVKGKSALTRSFNYQLMKLTFEIEINEVDYVEVLKSVVFHPGLLKEDDEMQSPISGRGCTDRQYKRIIADFIELMGTQAIPNFQFTLMEYPIVEEALTYAVQAVTTRCYSEQGDITTASLLNWLSQTFAMNVEKHGKCYKFQESDIFLYEENEEEYYIAFLNEMAEVSDYSESAHKLDEKNSINDRLGINDRLSSHENELKGSHPDFAGPDLDDVEFKLVTDKYRNSAQPQGWRNKRTESPIARKTMNSDVMKEIAIREIDESIEKDKPSEQSKAGDTSKIGSLLDIMSERSSKDLKSPEVSSSRQFQEDDPVKLLTTRTNEDNPKIVITQELKAVEEEKQLYASNESDQMMTPQFPSNPVAEDDHYNPFTKKYSEQYMHIYEKGVPHYTAGQLSNDYKFGKGSEDTGFKNDFQQFKKSFAVDKNEDYSSGLNGYKKDYRSGYNNQVTPKPSYTFDPPLNYESNFSSKPSYGFDSPMNYESSFASKPSFNSGYMGDYSYGKVQDYSYQPTGVGSFQPSSANDFLKDSLDHLKLNNQGYSFNKKQQEEPSESMKLGSDHYFSKQDSFMGYKAPTQEFSQMKREPFQTEYESKQPILGSKDEQDDVFFRPQGKKHVASKAYNLASEAGREGVEDTKGTIYREFTDTRVLDVMNSFERRKTDAIRQRYRGVHRKDLVRRK